jgi:hypothetical protein
MGLAAGFYADSARRLRQFPETAEVGDDDAR